MKKNFALLLALMIGSHYARTQGFEPAGGRSAGMGYTAVLLFCWMTPGVFSTTPAACMPPPLPLPVPMAYAIFRRPSTMYA